MSDQTPKDDTPGPQDGVVHMPVQCVVHTQGAVVVNDAYCHRRGDKIVAIYVDLASKRAEYGGASSGEDIAPMILLVGNEETLHINEEKRGETTLIEFPEFVGWNVFAAHVARYTLAVVLVV